MSIIKDTFFGGAEKKAAQAQERSAERGMDFIREGIETARGDINRLYPQAQDMLAGGFQGALDVFGQALPQQADVFQQGNMGAQQALMAGLPQANAAILGGPIDYSALQQPTALSYDMGWAQQQLPTAVTDAIEQSQQQQVAGAQQNISPFQTFQQMTQGGGFNPFAAQFNPNQYRS